VAPTARGSDPFPSGGGRRTVADVWEFTAGRWSSGPVRVAVGPLERTRGLIPRTDLGLLLRARSVHGIGMAHPLLVVGLAGRLVTAVGLLTPGGLVVDRTATALLELPPWRDAPLTGETLALRRIR
jgi:hypothetical protein